MSTSLTKALFNLLSCSIIDIENIAMTSSSLLYSPMVYADFPTLFTFSNNALTNVVLENADLIYLKKPIQLYSATNTYKSITVPSSSCNSFNLTV